MEKVKNQTLIDIDHITDVGKLVAILELICYKLDIDTVSETARKNKKLGIRPSTPAGVRKSKKYIKIDFGVQTMVVKGKGNNLPFY